MAVSPSFHRRHLPHWQPGSRDIFITWRLYGSLPAHMLHPTKGLSGGKAFLRADQYLDRAGCGPTWLKDPRLAEMIVDTLHYSAANLRLYDLQSYVIMSNHVHILIHPHSPLARIMRSVKSFTATKANQLLERKGHRFWQDESFDHWVRTPGEFSRIASYIERNPVSAGLVQNPEDWPWSSARK